LAAWTDERLTYEGRFHRFEDVEVLPKPVQRPHPPTWVAASSEGAVRWAGERGLSILMDPHSPHAEIARKRGIYAEVLAKAGHDVAGRDLPMARLVAVAETDEAALAVAQRGAGWTAGAYIPKQAIGQFRPDAGDIDPLDHYLSDVVIHGCPERVADQLEALRETMSLEYLLLSPLSRKTFELFNDRVRPRIAAPALGAEVA